MFTKSVDIMKILFPLTFFAVFITESFSQSTNDILNLLISNKIISQVQLSGYSQVRFQSLQETGKKDGFDIRRARLDFNDLEY